MRETGPGGGTPDPYRDDPPWSDCQERRALMVRTSRPWYSAQKRCYKAYVRGRRVTLLTGDENPVNEKLAAKKLRQILSGSKHDGPASLRGADVSDRYLKLHNEKPAC